MLAMHFCLKTEKVLWSGHALLLCMSNISPFKTASDELYEISDAGFHVLVKVLSSLRLTVNKMVKPVCQINSVNVSCILR